MNPIWRDRIVAAVGALLAVWLAFQVAEGSLGLPVAAASAAIALVLVRLVRQSLDGIVLGVLLIGYVVGNRGFAQLMPVPGIPLLPGEFGLTVGLAYLLWRSARDKTLPWRRNMLEHLLLAWILVGTARFIFDVRQYGFVAVRDFATVYYVAFFFITRRLCENNLTKQFLLRCLLVASALLPLVYALAELFPGFFLATLAIRGVPLIYFKGDLANTFLAVGGIVLFLTAPDRYRWVTRPLGILMLIWVYSSDARASMLGTSVALGWILLSRFRAFAVLQGAVLCLALMGLAGVANFTDNPLAVHKLRSVTERAMTVVDVSGQFNYEDAYSVSKTGNNQFRWVWWRTVAGETLAQNPALGLGFGYDLARGFLQEYNPDLGEDFSARSPHNIFVTTLGRMGLVGLGILLWVAGVLVVQTWRTMRNPESDPAAVAVWASVWVILISACLGVVLEGPMGAVLFWTLLGLASSNPSSAEGVPEAETAEDPLRPAEAVAAHTP